MTKILNIVTSKHTKTKRNYIQRMNNKKVKCMNIGRKYDYNYWDGDRKFGYGGYKFIQGYWTNVAKKIIKIYKIKNNSKILDIGCGKGFLLYEIKNILPEVEIVGFDISSYAIRKSKKEIKKYLYKEDAKNKTKFKNKNFDLVISLGTLHNLQLNDLEKSIKEINRISKKSFIMVESYRNTKELFNLQCWALTANSFFSKNEWLWILKRFKFKGDLELIYFS